MPLDEEPTPGDAPAIDTVQPAPIAPEAMPSRAAQIIEAWFVANIHNSPASRDVECFNHIRAAVDVLKTKIEEI